MEKSHASIACKNSHTTLDKNKILHIVYVNDEIFLSLDLSDLIGIL